MSSPVGDVVVLNRSLVQKAGWTALAGSLAFVGSALSDNLFPITIAEQLILTLVAGGVVLLVQFLADFDRRLKHAESDRRGEMAYLREMIGQGFAGVSEAAALLADVERSSLNRDAVKGAIRGAGLFRNGAGSLIRAVADSEVERLAGTLRALADRQELFYEGEDRELLLALARRCSTSIMATSWITSSASGMGFEAGFWLNDLGGRYLGLQRTAVSRGVRVRRAFIVESPELIESESVRRILTMQESAGIEVRILVGGTFPSESIDDYVIFDEQVAYETMPITRGEPSAAPWLLTTRLVLEEEAVRLRVQRYEELWNHAVIRG